MKLIEIVLKNAQWSPATYTYKLKINDTIVHYGKFFVQARQTKVILDVEEILWNHRFKGQQMIAPVLSLTDNQFVMPEWELASDFNVLSDYWYDTVRVEDTEETPRFTSTPATFFFVPQNAPGYKGIVLPQSGAYVPVLDNGIVPHIPSNPPSGFRWSTMYYNVDAGSITVRKDGETASASNPQGNTAYVNRLDGASEKYEIKIGDGEYRTITTIDQCNKPYYLIWLANNGAMQCQGFLKSTEFSVKYLVSSRMDVHNWSWQVASTETATWRLKSSHLNESEYQAYGEMFNSPYLVLLDMENSRLHYVTMKTTDYREKKRTRNDSKPFYFDVEVTASEHLRN